MLYAIMYNEITDETTVKTFWSYPTYFSFTFSPALITTCFIDTNRQPPGKTYHEKKESLREQAIEYQHAWSENDCFLSWGELAEMDSYFNRYGKRYGLLKEFHENCIC